MLTPKDKLVRALLTAAVAIVRSWPIAAHSALATALRGIAAPFAGKDRRNLRRNVALVYGLPAGTHFARMFERQVFRHQLRCAVETLRATFEPARVQIAGLDELRELVVAAESGGRGHIVVTGHVGSWELCGYYARRVGERALHALAKPSKQPGATPVLDGLRRRLGIKVLWTDRKTLLRDMLETLRRGEALGFVMDQKPAGRKGHVVDFLGRPTEFVGGPAAVAVRTQCAVIAAYCLREGPMRFRVVSELIAPSGHVVADEAALTAKLAASIDRVVRAYPEQWTWNYRRWRESGVVPGS